MGLFDDVMAEKVRALTQAERDLVASAVAATLTLGPKGGVRHVTVIAGEARRLKFSRNNQPVAFAEAMALLRALETPIANEMLPSKRRGNDGT